MYEITDEMKKEAREHWFVNGVKGIYYLSFAKFFDKEKYAKAKEIYASL